MTKWEYRHLPAGYGTWDVLGQEGWELVGFDPNGRAHFKRPVAEELAPKADPPEQPS